MQINRVDEIMTSGNGTKAIHVTRVISSSPRASALHHQPTVRSKQRSSEVNPNDATGREAVLRERLRAAGITLIRLETREKDASRSACAREWSASRRRLRSSICEAMALLRSPTLDAPAAGAGWGDAAGEGEGEAAATRGVATRGERAAGLARALGFGGEAEEPGEERKLMSRSAGKEPGDDDAGEEAPPRTGRLRVRVRVRDAGAGDASGERKEGSCFGLGLRLGLEAAAGVARGLPMAPLPVGWGWPLRSASAFEV
jgi:hypothetical protein